MSNHRHTWKNSLVKPQIFSSHLGAGLALNLGCGTGSWFRFGSDPSTPNVSQRSIHLAVSETPLPSVPLLVSPWKRFKMTLFYGKSWYVHGMLLGHLHSFSFKTCRILKKDWKISKKKHKSCNSPKTWSIWHVHRSTFDTLSTLASVATRGTCGFRLRSSMLHGVSFYTSAENHQLGLEISRIGTEVLNIYI